MYKRHFWIMLACCLIPVLAFTAIFFLKVPLNTALYVGMILLCPLTHVLMMRSMHENTAESQQPHEQHMTSEKP
jgi:uncharacterized membrane protein